MFIFTVLCFVAVLGYNVWRTLYWYLGRLANFDLRLVRPSQKHAQADIAVDEFKVKNVKIISF